MSRSRDQRRPPVAQAFRPANHRQAALKGCATLIAAVVCVTSPAFAQSDVAFPKEVYAARRAKLLDAAGDSAIVVPGRYSIGDESQFKQDPTFWYLTGVESPFATLVMVRASGRTRTALFLPDRYQFAGGQFPMADEAFRRAMWNRPIRRLAPGPEATAATGISETFAVDTLGERIAEMTTGVSTVFLPLNDGKLYAPPGLSAPMSVAGQIVRSITERLPGKQIKDVTPLVGRMRLIKDSYEIAALRKATAISGQGLVAAMRAIRPGMNDRDVAAVMEYTWKQAGSPRPGGPPIVASGPNSMKFFSLMSENFNQVDRVMRDGELLFVDYGAADYQTYVADLCRTFPVSGRFSADQRKDYDIVLEAQMAAIDAIRPGVMMIDVIKKSAEVFRKHGLEPYEDTAKMGEDKVWGIMPSPTHYLTRNAGIVPYTPRGVGVRDLGHHIGLEAHDSRDYSRPLEPGMVITVEPKIYIPEKQIAIMIEDMILVTPTGHDNLSEATPKLADDVERTMEAARPERPISSEVVSFPSGSLTLHGVLFKPEGRGPFPAILYNHGSEPSPRDLPELGPLFVKHGYVILGPTRRGHGRSVAQGPYISELIEKERREKGDAAWSALMVKLLETDHLDDQMAGLDYLKSLPFVDAKRIAVMGGSFGGIETVLAAERGNGLRAAIDFAGAAQTWAASADVRDRMMRAVRNAKMPIYFIQAENDYDTTPSKALAAEMARAGKPHKMKIYPPWGTTHQQGHVFGVRGSALWEAEVFAFLEEHNK